MKKSYKKIAALSATAAIIITTFGIFSNAAGENSAIDYAIDSIKATHAFTSDNIVQYKEWQSNLNNFNVAEKLRIDNAIERLENGVDYYDDFNNFGDYIAGEYPENAGEIMPVEKNTSNYDVIWAGLNEVDDTLIYRKPYSTNADYRNGAYGKRLNTFIGSKNNSLHFASYDVVMQNYNGTVMSIENWYDNDKRAWKNGVFKCDMQNAKLNLLTIKSNVNSGRQIKTVKISTPVGNTASTNHTGFLIYDYTDINNWQAVCIAMDRGWYTI